VTARRLSQAIAEGDGISVLVEIRDGDGARAAEEGGAEGLVVRASFAAVTELPLLAYGPLPEEAAAGSADAVVLTPGDGDDAIVGHVERCHELGIEVVVRVSDDDELARATGLPAGQVQDVRRAARAVTSLDRPLGEHEGATLGDLFESEEGPPEELVEVSLREATVRRAVADLPSIERQVLKLRYGLDGRPDPKSVAEVERQLGLSREDVRRIERMALAHLARTRELQGLEDAA